jgi:hypothetical protein
LAYEAPDYYGIDELLTDEERLVRDTARRFVDEEFMPRIVESYRQGTFPMELVAEGSRADPSRECRPRSPWRSTRPRATFRRVAAGPVFARAGNETDHRAIHGVRIRRAGSS